MNTFLVDDNIVHYTFFITTHMAVQHIHSFHYVFSLSVMSMYSSAEGPVFKQTSLNLLKYPTKLQSMVTHMLAFQISKPNRLPKSISSNQDGSNVSTNFILRS